MFPAPGGIDIYFTNRIYAPTWKRLSEFWLSIDPKGININPPSLSPISDKGTDLSHLKPKQVSDMDYDAMGAYWRIWVLKPDAKFGTVLLDQDASRMEDREVWQRYLPHQSTLEEFMKTTYYSDAIPTIKILEVKYTWEAKIVKWKEEDLENERIKRRKKEEPPPPKSMDVPPAAPLSVVPPNPGKAEAVMVDNLMADAPLTSQIVPKHTEPQVPPLRIPWATLVKFGLAVGDIDLFPVALVVSLIGFQLRGLVS